MHQADLASKDRGEAFAGHEEAARPGRADLAQDIGRDHRRSDAQLHLAKGQARRLGGNHDIAHRQQAQPAAHRSTIHPRHHRRGEEIDRVEDQRQLSGLPFIALLRRLDRRLHHRQIRTRAERLARTRQNHARKLLIPCQFRKSCLQIVEQLRIERVMHLWPVHRNRSNAPVVAVLNQDRLVC